MTLDSLNSISPVDGRYRAKTESLAAYFSEYAYFRYRVHVEVEYFIALVELPLPPLKNFPKKDIPFLRSITKDFCLSDAERIKQIEKKINHDVKAVEYFIKEKFSEKQLEAFSEFVHFGLTSQDINNTSVPLALEEAITKEYLPLLDEVIAKLKSLGKEWKNIPMLAHTHGQSASPTMLGKEILVFVERLEGQKKLLSQVPHGAKFGGATGNFNAHYVAYPKIDWVKFANDFVGKKLGLKRYQFTTQIEHYDNMGAIFDTLKRINTILTDLSQDCWTYISMDYFKQKINKDEVGSSAMPHKVNPIDFENAEGNFGIANSGFEFLSRKLPISRLQRDLTDSTVTRNIGVPFAHTIISFQSLLKGLNKIVVNKEKIDTDLEQNWAVVAEAIQTILRREGVEKPYEKLKELTRSNGKMKKEVMHKFIEGLKVNSAVKKELKTISPFNYTGKVG